MSGFAVALFVLSLVSLAFSVETLRIAKRYEKAAEEYRASGDESWNRAMKVWRSALDERIQITKTLERAGREPTP